MIYIFDYLSTQNHVAGTYRKFIHRAILMNTYKHIKFTSVFICY